MLDLDRLSDNFKTIARAAEDIFMSLKTEESKTDKEGRVIDMEDLQGDSTKSKASKFAKDVLKNFDAEMALSLVDSFVGDYLKRHQDFAGHVPVKIKKWSHFKGELPRYESTGASGLDVRAQLEEPISIQPGERCLVPTGISMEVPIEYEIQARPRSGLALKKGLSLVNTPGTIDADYRGEIKIILINLGKESVSIEDQERIAQLVICPVVKADFEVVEDLSDTERGSGGFGSTGTK